MWNCSKSTIKRPEQPQWRRTTTCSSVSIVNFEQVIASWVNILILMRFNFVHYESLFLSWPPIRLTNHHQPLARKIVKINIQDFQYHQTQIPELIHRKNSGSRAITVDNGMKKSSPLYYHINAYFPIFMFVCFFENKIGISR